MSIDNSTSATSKDFEKPNALKNFASIYVQEVIWNDMDAFNHVNNVVYYRYAESARINYLETLKAFNEEVVTVLAQSSCVYLKPVTYPDTLLIGVRSKKIGNSSIVMEYCYVSTVQQEVVATGESVLVRLNKYANAKAPWSEKERDAIIKFEQTADYTPQL